MRHILALLAAGLLALEPAAGLAQDWPSKPIRVVIPFEEQDAIAIVTQALEGNGHECILDLDTFSDQPQGIAENEMWGKLDQLREVKNRLCFGSFTEAALERFK